MFAHTVDKISNASVPWDFFFISQKFYIKYLESYKQRECLLSERIWTFKILIFKALQLDAFSP